MLAAFIGYFQASSLAIFPLSLYLCVNADKYFTPITPNGWTFSIWGFIFFGEALYAIFQLLPSQRNRAYHKDIAGWVMCAFVLQSLWLLCWYGLALRL